MSLSLSWQGLPQHLQSRVIHARLACCCCARRDKCTHWSERGERDLLNMILDAHSLSWCTRRQFFFTITPRKSQRSTVLRWLRYLRESQARHTFTSSITSRALTDITLTVKDLTHLQPTPRLTLSALFFVFGFLAARHPADIDNVSCRWCPGTDHVMTWYPCLSGPGLHCRVPFSPLCFFSPKAEGTGMSKFFT